MPILKITEEGIANSEKYSPVDPGDYVLEAVEATERETREGPNKGNINTVVIHKIAGNSRGEATQFDGKYVDIYVMEGFAIQWLLAFYPTVFPNLQAIKDRVALATADPDKAIKITTEQVSGKRAIATIVNGEYKNKKNNTVNGLRPMPV